MVSQRRVARHRHVTPADQSHIREGVVGGATRAGRDERGAGTGAAGDAVDAGGVKGFAQGHGRQSGGQAACQHRLARHRGARACG